MSPISSLFFISKEYKTKEWTGLEWRSIRDLIKKRREDAIMTFRFDDTAIPGLFSHDGYISVDNDPPETIARLIFEKLSIQLPPAETPPLPEATTITPAEPGEHLIIVGPISADHGGSNRAATIAGQLRQELLDSPATSISGQLGTWRIIEAHHNIGKEEALPLAKSKRALIILNGRQDGETTNIDVTVNISGDSTSLTRLRHLDFGIRNSTISISGSNETLRRDLAPICLYIKACHQAYDGDLPSAAQTLTQSLSASTSNAVERRTRRLRGIIAYYTGDLPNAESDLSEALRMGPLDPEAQWLIGDIQLMTGRLLEAESSMKSAIATSGNTSESYYRCGMTIFAWRKRIPYFTQDDHRLFKNADDNFRLAMEKDPRNVDAPIARYNLHMGFAATHGRGFVIEHAMLAADKFLTEALRSNPDSTKIRCALSSYLLSFGDAAKAKSVLVEGLAGNTNTSPELLIGLSIIHELSNEPLEAIALIKQFLAAEASPAGTWWDRAVARCRLSKLEGNSDAVLVGSTSESLAQQRERQVLDLLRFWSGRVWNRSFHGSRSTQDALMSFLAEAGVIPPGCDYQSACQIFNLLLRKADSDQQAPDRVHWIQSGILAGSFAGVSTTTSGDYVCYYLEAEASGKLMQFDRPLPGGLYEARRIVMSASFNFSGD